MEWVGTLSLSGILGTSGSEGAEETQVCICSFVLPDQKSVGGRMVAPLGVTLSGLRERNLRVGLKLFQGPPTLFVKLVGAQTGPNLPT